MNLDKARELIGKKVSYWNQFKGTIEEVWDLQNQLTLAKVKGDSSFLIVNIDILKIE